MMSLSKPVPSGLRESECERTILREPPPVPYIPEEDPIQEMVSTLKKMHLRTTIGEDTTPQLSVWHTETLEALLMHMNTTLDAIKKHGHLDKHNKALQVYMCQRELVKQAKAAQLDSVTSKCAEKSKKPSKKAKEAEVMATTADVPDAKIRALYLQDIKKAKEAAEKARCDMATADNKMFQLYTNLLSAEAKYAWNKIVNDQTQSDTYKDLQGNSEKGPRGATHQSFEDCVMFHLLTMFPINVAEQQKYYTYLRRPSGSVCVILNAM
jgi:hypothetical protein